MTALDHAGEIVAASMSPPRGGTLDRRMVHRVCIIRQRDEYELPVRREAEALRDAGFEVDVICEASDGRRSEEVDNGVTLHRLPVRRQRGGSRLRYLYDYFAFFLLATWAVTRLHHRKRYAVIQVNTMPDFLVFSTIVPKLRGAKIVAFMKEPSPELGETLFGSALMTRVLKLVERLAIAYSDLAFTVTEQLKELEVSRGANPDKIQVILNGAGSEHLMTHDDGTGRRDPDHFTLLVHGAVEERYGQDTILEAVARVRSELPTVRLRITGTGEATDVIGAMIPALGLGDCVDYLGWVDMATVVRELRSADAGIVAQKSSPYSNLVHTNKMYEYLMFDMPVIASRLDSVHAYFGDDAVFWFEPGNADSLAAAILEVARNPQEARERLDRALELYQDYSWDRQRELYVDAVRSLTG
jgi:glycosyltransferase involved in cell wall biosynthesis